MIRRFVPALAIALVLAGCGPSQPVLQAPVTQTGTPAPLVPSRETPDEPLKQLGRLGPEVATLLGQDFGRLVPVTKAYYDAYDKFPKASAYTVQNFSGWEFRQGWFWSTENNDDLMIRARFESTAGTGPDWDVTDDGNYGADFHPAFPGDLVRVRYEYERKLTDGRMALTLFAEVGDRQAPVTLKGSGSAYVPTTLGQVGFEALNAVFKADGTLEKGDLTLKSQFEAITRQFSGPYGPQGLIGRGKMYKSQQPVGEVSLVEGKWTFQNEGGSYPLQ